MNLTRCRILVAITFLLTQSTYVLLPVIPLIASLFDAETGKTRRLAPGAWQLVANPLFEMALVALSLACVVLAIRGLRREVGSRNGWIALLVVAVLISLQACGFAIFLQTVCRHYHDLGIK